VSQERLADLATQGIESSITRTTDFDM